MCSNDNSRTRLQLLQREYEEITASLPAHSIPSSMLIRLEELEDEIATLKQSLQQSNASTMV